MLQTERWSLDWPLSGREKLLRVVQLYDSDVQAADEQLRALTACNDALRDELFDLTIAAGGLTISNRPSLDWPLSAEEGKYHVTRLHEIQTQDKQSLKCRRPSFVADKGAWTFESPCADLEVVATAAQAAVMAARQVADVAKEVLPVRGDTGSTAGDDHLSILNGNMTEEAADHLRHVITRATTALAMLQGEGTCLTETSCAEGDLSVVSESTSAGSSLGRRSSVASVASVASVTSAAATLGDDAPCRRCDRAVVLFIGAERTKLLTRAFLAFRIWTRSLAPLRAQHCERLPRRYWRLARADAAERALAICFAKQQSAELLLVLRTWWLCLPRRRFHFAQSGGPTAIYALLRGQRCAFELLTECLQQWHASVKGRRRVRLAKCHAYAPESIEISAKKASLKTRRSPPLEPDLLSRRSQYSFLCV